MENKGFVLDTENLVRAGRIPVIIGIALGLTWLLHIYLGYLYSPVLTVLEAVAGGLYMKIILDSGKRPLLINAGFNGAILGAVFIAVYLIVSWISGSIASKDWSFNMVALIIDSIEGAFIGLLGALSWYAYKTNLN